MRLRVLNALEDETVETVALPCREITDPCRHVNRDGTTGTQSYGNGPTLNKDELEVIRDAEAQTINGEIHQAHRGCDERNGRNVRREKINLVASRTLFFLGLGLSPIVHL